MDAIAELNRRLANLIATGTVAQVRHNPPRCRVAIGKRTTEWLAWVEPCAGETSTWNPPAEGEQVVVLSPSGELAAGIVLRGLPSDAHPTPSNAPAEHVTRYPDGALIDYNHATGVLRATGLKTAIVQGSGRATVDFPKAQFTGDVHVKGALVVDKLLTYNGGMSGRPGSGGRTAITGDIAHSDGRLTSNGVVLDNHGHDGVQRGSDDTVGTR